MNGTSALTKETPQSSVSAVWGCQDGSAVCSLEEGSRQTPNSQQFGLGRPSLQNYEEYISVVYKPPSLWYFVMAAWKD